MWKVIKNGLWSENPTFRLVLGMCPTLAVTTQAMNGIGMGLAATFVLICSNLVISLLRHFIPDKIRIPAFIVVIATFVTVVQLFMQAFVPSLFEQLGIYIPLIVVNCIIFARAEGYACKVPPLLAIADGIGMGLGFTAAITVLGSIRELIGNGTIFGVSVLGSAYQPMLIAIMAPGGFILLGLLMMLFNNLTARLEKRKIDSEGGAA